MFVLALVLFPELHPAMSALADPPKAHERPFVVEYYYKAKWGHADEFIRLFKKNHYPVLKKQVETGPHAPRHPPSSRATTPPRTAGGITG